MSRDWSTLFGLLIRLLAGWVLCLSTGLQAAPLELTRAQVTLDVDGASTVRSVGLPYPWDRFHKGQAGRALFRIDFDLAAVPDGPWALYLPRVGTAYEVWLNGRMLEHRGDMAQFNGGDYGQVPRYLNVPVGYLAPHNRIEVRIRADVGRRGGLSRLVLGPMDEVYPLYLREYRLRSVGSMLVVGFSLVVGLVSLALWATQARVTDWGTTQRDPLYLYAGLAELFWTVRVGHTQIEVPPLDWPWWGVLPVTALGAWGAFMTFFCLELAGVRRSSRLAWGFRRWLTLLMLLGPLVGVLALGLGRPLVLTVWYAALGLSFLAFGAWFIGHAVRTPSRMQRVVAAAVVINVVTGLRDLYVFRIEPAYPSNAMMYYTSMLFGLTLGYVVLSRFRAVSAQARELMHAMAVRIAERERELNSSYQRLEALAREQERTNERARILRDMHDGVGSHISAAIRQLQSGRARQEDVLQTLRDSLDQLKLTIDAMHLPPGDVTALLANLRYRLEPRLQASDIALQWDVDLIEPIARLDAQAMRHLQFMVFEAISNVLQHAQATWLRIEAVPAGQGGRLRILDNGRGFDVAAPPRKGLVSLRERAQAIGAQLRIESAPGRTLVEVLVPGG
jgi:signal transduction histidine kinase